MNKPTQKDLNQMLTTSQVHFAMESYAKGLRCPDLIMKTIFKDGSELLETFEPAKKEVFYRVKFEDNEQYSVFVDVKNKYDYSDQNLGKSSILKREKAFMKEKGLEYESISFESGE